MDEQELEKKSLDLIIEEYKSLRTESLNTIGHRISIMGYSFGTLAIVASVTVSAKVPDLIVAFILGIVVPALAKTVTLVWIAEYSRSQRAGAAIARLEERINARLKDIALSWESNLRLKNIKTDKPYKDTINLFLMIGSVSEIISIPYVFDGLYSNHQFGGAVSFQGVPARQTGSLLLACVLTIVFVAAVSYIEAVMRIHVRREWDKANFFATPESIRAGVRASVKPVMESELTVASKAFFAFHQQSLKRFDKLENGALRLSTRVWTRMASILRRRSRL